MGSLFRPLMTPAAKVLVVGGSYGGLSAALNLQDLCRGRAPRCGPKPAEGEHVERHHFDIDITIVDERDGFYHTIGTPLALASEAYADKAWVKYDDIPALQSPNIRVLQGTVQSVDQARKVAAYVARGTTQPSELKYDYLVAAAGLRRVWPVVPQSLRKKQYLFEMGDHIRAVTAAKHGVVVVGGGAVGIEMAAELKLTHPDLRVTLVHSRAQLLSAEKLPDEVKDRSLELLRDGGVEVLLSHRLDRTEEIKADDGNGSTAKCFRVHFTNGHSMLADHVAVAISKPAPSTGFLSGDVLDEEGYVKIQASLAFPPASPNPTSHYAVGDLVRWSGIKRCGAAMHMGYYAAHNIHQEMQMQQQQQQEQQQEQEEEKCLAKTEPSLLKLEEIPPMIGLAVGKQAVAYWPEGGVTWGEDVLKAFFNDDLGFSICWNHMALGEKA